MQELLHISHPKKRAGANRLPGGPFRPAFGRFGGGESACAAVLPPASAGLGDAHYETSNYPARREADPGVETRLRILPPLRSGRTGNRAAVSRRARAAEQRVLSALSEPICGSVPQSHGRLVLDNGQFHKAKKLSIPKNVELTFLPPYSPELNPVERFWQDPLADWPLTSTSTYRVCDKRPEWLFVVTPIERSLP